MKRNSASPRPARSAGVLASILFATLALACLTGCGTVNPTIQGIATTVEGVANKVDSIGVQIANGAARIAGTNAVPVLAVP